MHNLAIGSTCEGCVLVPLSDLCMSWLHTRSYVSLQVGALRAIIQHSTCLQRILLHMQQLRCLFC
jgi:hypothetical protein